VDLLAADAHKWLLGPCGAGIMYVRQSLQERLNPPIYGWHNVLNPNFVAQEQIQMRGGPQKFEAGTANLLGVVGLVSAMGLLLEVGVENIAAELLRKRAWLVPALQAKGYQVLHPDLPPLNASGIVSFHKPGQDLAALHEKLRSHSIFTSLRTDRAGKKYIRLSPHFYNTQGELEQVVNLL
jgi:selenocysteine lyase/cysteine desulfurase